MNIDNDTVLWILGGIGVKIWVAIKYVATKFEKKETENEKLREKNQELEIQKARTDERLNFIKTGKSRGRKRD